MVLPLALALAPSLIGMAGMAGSAYSNYKKQQVQRNLYSQFERGYNALDSGYRRYLKTQGKTVNTNRALGSFYGQSLKSRANIDASNWSTIGTTSGAIGAGAIGLGAGAGRTWRYMK